MLADQPSNPANDPREVHSKRDLAQFLGASLSPQYRVSTDSGEVRQTATYLKTYLVEAHHFGAERIAADMGGWFAHVRRTRDDHLIHMIDQKEVSYFADLQDDRFLMIHSTGEARLSDETIANLTDSRGSGFDRAWMPASFLRQSYRGTMTGFKYSYRQEVEGFTLADVSRPSEEAPSEKQRTSFRLEVSGQQHAEQDLDAMSEAPILVGRKALEQIEYREADNSSDSLSLSIYSYGKMVGHGTSLGLHLDNTTSLTQSYGAIIRTIEDHHALGWERTKNGSIVHRGAPFVARFPRTLVVTDLQRLAQSIFRPSKPFRLYGLFSSAGQNRVDIEAIDLHSGHPLSIEMTPRWMRIYLPVGTCGNVLARLYTNLQHSLHSDITITSGSGVDLFGAGSADETR